MEVLWHCCGMEIKKVPLARAQGQSSAVSGKNCSHAEKALSKRLMHRVGHVWIGGVFGFNQWRFIATRHIPSTMLFAEL